MFGYYSLHHVRHRSYSAGNRSLTVALPSLPLLSLALLLLLFLLSQHLPPLPPTLAVDSLHHWFGCSKTSESLGFLRVSRLLLCLNFDVSAS
jgi:hypothetical protein